MVIGSGLHRLPSPVDGFRFGDHFANPVGVRSYRFDGFNRVVNGDLASVVPGYSQSRAFDPSSTPTSFNPIVVDGDDSHRDPEICSDLALGYINRILMEEDADEKADVNHPDPALLAAQKPFLEILSTAGPNSPDGPPLYSDSLGSPQDSLISSANHVDDAAAYANHADSGCESGIGDAFDDDWLSDYVCELHSVPELRSLCLHYAPQSPFSSCDSNGYGGSIAYYPGVEVEEEEGRRLSTESYPNILLENEHRWECQFRRGMEEASKFLPEANKLVVDLESMEFFQPAKPRGEDAVVVGRCRDGKSEESCYSFEKEPRGRKKPYHEDLDAEEGRITKQSAVVHEEPVRTSIFDEVLLCNCGKNRDVVAMLREALQNQISKNAKGAGVPKGPRGKSRGGKKRAKEEVIDLRTLLIHCAQYVATDDRRSAGELLRQIRQHSSDKGDGTQRLAQIFADGLEARLAGTGSERYHSFMAKRQSAINVLKAYHLFIAACPFKRISHFFANQTILNVAENAKKLHIVDFGISFGFQWPCLIQRLSVRPGGPPKLRITGIDIPQPGFRPTERLEETGRRLADYSQSFGVPFEYQQIATKWEDIKVADLNLREDEVLVVNCMYGFRHVADETVAVGSPRSVMLAKVRRMNPDIFIHGVVNGSFSAPFFVTRFREALFHYSSLFDMLDTTVPREHPERLLIETEIFGPEAMNVIACEGSERVERPETYKQWQVRNLRARFRHLPLNPEIMKKCRDRVRSFYHRDFLFDEDSRWLLQGWKGRIIFALSTWKPADNKGGV